MLIANSLLIAVLAKLGHRVDRMSAGFHIVLFVFTLGFYCWYWAYRAQRGHEASRRAKELGGPLGLLLWILFYRGQRVRDPVAEIGADVREGRAETPPVRGWTGLWLFPFGILIVPAIVWFVKVQGNGRPRQRRGPTGAARG